MQTKKRFNRRHLFCTRVDVLGAEASALRSSKQQLQSVIKEREDLMVKNATELIALQDEKGELVTVRPIEENNK